ncbi:lhr domain protein [Mycobacterium xenopi 4042]|uniref:Lhr domain protein n=1 Tax=Mycobacterium xenopi 4042 TaxID=1299334 RepID=X7YIH2_MYCXE|nr:lhr domain protein [Mycobacterium xenopi 4042]
MRRGATVTTARPAAKHRAHRRERVAGDPARPNKFPQRCFQF